MEYEINRFNTKYHKRIRNEMKYEIRGNNIK